MDVIKKILPVLIGILSGVLLVRFGEAIIEFVYPMPENLDINNEAQLADYIKDMPAGAYIMLLANYALSAFAAGLIATAIAKKNNRGLRHTTLRPAIICGGILTIAGFVNAVTLPHPWWYAAMCLMVCIPSSYLGFLMLRRRKPAEEIS